MTNTLDMKPTMGTAIRAISGKWGWFVALGILDLILGGIASTNLLLANLASVLFIGAAVLVSGIFQIVHAFWARGLRSFLFWLLGGIVYAAAGGVILYDPILASIELSLLAGVFLAMAGILRIWPDFIPVRPRDGDGSWLRAC